MVRTGELFKAMATFNVMDKLENDGFPPKQSELQSINEIEVYGIGFLLNEEISKKHFEKMVREEEHKLKGMFSIEDKEHVEQVERELVVDVLDEILKQYYNNHEKEKENKHD